MAVATMRVPTVFLAIDKFSDVVSKMTNKTTMFSKSASSAINRVDHRLNNMWGSMNNISQLAIGGGVGGLFYYAGKDIKDYEVKIASLAAVTGTQIGAMNSNIESLGKRTRMSVIDVAGAFEIVGSKMSQYLKNPKALEDITNASITMSRAARMELEPAINSLTGIMNIYRMSSEDAARVVNKLSAGETVGSVSIAQTSEILTQFGAQAVRANVPIEESIALIQTLTKSMGVIGVGRGLRNILFDISSTETWDKNRWKAIRMAGVDFKFVTDNAQDLTARLRELKKLSSVKGAMELFFKRTGTIAANTLFQNFDKEGFTEFLGKIKALNDAEAKASKNTSTLSSMIDQMKASFTNFVVTGDNANGMLSMTKSLVGWITDNMRGLINMTESVIIAFLGWKTIVWTISLASSVLSIFKSIQKANLIITQIATFRSIAYSEALWLVVAAQWAAYWPILLTIAALGLLTYAFWDNGDSAENMSDRQVNSLSRSNSAWINSTNVISEQLKKQQALLDNAVAKQKTPTSKNKFYDEASKLDPMSPNFDVQKFNELNAKGRQFSKENFIKDILPRFTKKEPDYLKRDGFVPPENLAGKRDLELDRMYRFAAKERDLNIKISTEEGLKAQTQGDIPSGINPVLTPNQGARGKQN